MIDRILKDQLEQNVPPKAVVILGARRVGKTTLLRWLSDRFTTQWFDGDDPFSLEMLMTAYKGGGFPALLSSTEVIVIDEAQGIPDIGRILKLLVDKNEKTKIFVTGSSSLHLAGGILESAIGRLSIREMWPLALEELAKEKGWSQVQANLSQYLTYGLLPAPLLSSNPRELLEDYCRELLFKDVFRLNLVRKPNVLLHLVQYLATNIGSEINFDNLSREIGVSKNTVAAYMDALEQCYIIKRCDSFAKNLPNELKKGKKIYFVDLGVRNALVKDFRPFPAREDAGALWENFVYMERLKLHSYRQDFNDLFFWRTREGPGKPHEIDFIEVLDRQPIRAFECKLSAKAQIKAKGLFHEAYPNCPVRRICPSDLLQTWASTASLETGQK